MACKDCTLPSADDKQTNYLIQNAGEPLEYLLQCQFIYSMFWVLRFFYYRIGQLYRFSDDTTKSLYACILFRGTELFTDGGNDWHPQLVRINTLLIAAKHPDHAPLAASKTQKVKMRAKWGITVIGPLVRSRERSYYTVYRTTCFMF